MSFYKFTAKFLSVFFIGFFAFYCLSINVNPNNTPVPWALLALITFPFGYCIAVFFKVSEADENTSLSDTELRRLHPIIEIKKRHLGFLIYFYLIAAFSGAIGLVTIPKASTFYIYFISFIGGEITASLYSFRFISSMNSEIQKFKSILLHRSENNKRKSEFLDSLNKNED